MTSAEFKRYFAKLGCAFEPGNGGHLKVSLGDKRSIPPMHGKNKELKTGTVEATKKQLGLK